MECDKLLSQDINCDVAERLPLYPPPKGPPPCCPACPHLSAPCPSPEPRFSFPASDVSVSSRKCSNMLNTLSICAAVRPGSRAQLQKLHLAMKALTVTANWPRAIHSPHAQFLLSSFSCVSPQPPLCSFTHIVTFILFYY